MASRNQISFRKWWWLIPVAVAIGIGGAFTALQFVQPQFSATCRLFVATPPTTTPAESYQAGQFGQTRVAAYLDLIKGDRVANGAIDSIGVNLTASELEKRIEAKADAQSVLINVSVTDSQAQLAADLANAVCREFLTVAADAEGPNPLVNVRLIEDASPPQRQVSPSPKTFLGVGGLSGLLIAIGMIVLLGRRPSEVTECNSEVASFKPDDPRQPTIEPALQTDGAPAEGVSRTHGTRRNR